MARGTSPKVFKLERVTLAPDAIGKVIDFYKGTLAKAGWKVPSSFLSEDGGMMYQSKPSSVAVSRHGGRRR